MLYFHPRFHVKFMTYPATDTPFSPARLPFITVPLVRHVTHALRSSGDPYRDYLRHHCPYRCTAAEVGARARFLARQHDD